jgi:hypothetical protein
MPTYLCVLIVKIIGSFLSLPTHAACAMHCHIIHLMLHL